MSLAKKNVSATAQSHNPPCMPYLQVPWDDPGLFVVPGGVSCQLQNLCGQVLHHGRQVDGGASTNALRIIALPQKTMDPTHIQIWSLAQIHSVHCVEGLLSDKNRPLDDILRLHTYSIVARFLFPAWLERRSMSVWKLEGQKKLIVFTFHLTKSLFWPKT